MIICSAPWRIAASCPLGNPPCCFAYGKIRYISRSKSRSVSIAPFTRATGLSLTPVGDGDGVFGFAVVVEAWEATWELAVTALASSRAKTTRDFMFPPMKTSKKIGKIFASLPRHSTVSLENGGYTKLVVPFVGLAKVALTAELRGRG